VLRSGDAWVEGSRQFKDFNTYLIPLDEFTEIKQHDELTLKAACDQYLQERLTLLEKRLAKVNKLATEDALPDAIITKNGLKITPIEAIIPANAKNFVNQVTALLPRVKITELLLEVDEWTNFTQHFKDLTSGEMGADSI
jgi:hypothetical protein